LPAVWAWHLLKLNGTSMSTAYFESALAFRSFPAFSQLRTILIEALLVVLVAAFWFVALPLVGVSVICVQVWDALAGTKSGRAPLFLRSIGSSKSAPAHPDHNHVGTGQL
jgi:hypothetical protein